MDTNGMQGGVLPSMTSGILGLEMPIHPHHPNPHHSPYPHNPNHHHQHQMVSFAAHGAEHPAQSQQSIKQNSYPYPTKGKQQQLGLSDEDEHGFTTEDGGDGRKRVSPWQRVKWTDNMVKLLIMVVFYIGDDIVPEANDPSSTTKKKSGGGGLLQKKGKWKSVSQAMMEKGFYVSPQQCEDKFNDLNKRYKRVNDILGKGTACKVVENQSLLDSMDHLPPKMKEEARKLLNSKHLFFREMCAYHNSGGGVTNAHQSEMAVESSHHQQQQSCFHSSESATIIANSKRRVETDALKMVKIGSHEELDEDGEDDDDDVDDDVDDDEEEDYEDDEEIQDVGGKDSNEPSGGHEDDDDEDKFSSKKRRRTGMSLISPSIQQLSSELVNVLQDGTKSPWEQRKWMRNQSIQLEEQRVSYQCQAFKLEKRRFNWVKFSGKKEREMERMKLNNERMRLENERMVLLIRQKELELLDLHQQNHSSIKRPDPSSITG